MFPFVDGRRVPGREDARGDRADAGLHRDHLQARSSAGALIDAVHIDRLNLGPVPTIQLNWLQPHEGNIVDFLFRARAFQTRPVTRRHARSTSCVESYAASRGEVR